MNVIKIVWPWFGKDSWGMLRYFWYEANIRKVFPINIYFEELAAEHWLRQHPLTNDDLKRLAKLSTEKWDSNDN